ncbi:hypothetical protein B0H19DRAFT_1070350 [Mycena capillaripes]|nr:hypothetical protein B0H19DRAFT_1070350 [Mycena capillaripes]
MFFNTLFMLSALSFVAAIPQDIPEAFTVIRQVKVLTDVAPFIVTSTTVLTFTVFLNIYETGSVDQYMGYLIIIRERCMLQVAPLRFARAIGLDSETPERSGSPPVGNVPEFDAGGLSKSLEVEVDVTKQRGLLSQAAGVIDTCEKK